MIERLAPTMREQVILLEEIERLKNQGKDCTAPAAPSPAPPCLTSTSASTSAEPEPASTPHSLSFRTTTHGKWPLLYKLPDFPPTVVAALTRKDPGLTMRERSNVKSALVCCLFDQMSRYTL